MGYIFRKEGRAREEVEVLTIYLIVATVAGARVGHCLFYEPDVYLNDLLRIFMIWEGGLASHGGAIGILVALYLYSHRVNMRCLWILDRIVIAVAIAGCCIRPGNLMNSEMVGTATRFARAFVFVRLRGQNAGAQGQAEHLILTRIHQWIHYALSLQNATPPGSFMRSIFWAIPPKPVCIRDIFNELLYF